jgi:hypothetical protein
MKIGTENVGVGGDGFATYPLSYKLQYGTFRRRKKVHMSVYAQSIMGFTRSYRGHPGSVMFRWDSFAGNGKLITNIHLTRHGIEIYIKRAGKGLTTVWIGPAGSY